MSTHQSDYDSADLGETIAFIDLAQMTGNGFVCSDNDHAKQIKDWLVELLERRAITSPQKPEESE